MKRLLAFFTASLFVSMGMAAVVTPVDQRGNSLFNPDYVGVIATSIDASTGTAFVMLNSTAVNTGLSMGPSVVYGIVTSSISQNDYIVLKDTTGAGSNGQTAPQAGPGSLQGVGSTVAVVGNWFQNAVTTGSAVYNYPVVNVITFPRPIQFPNGILATVSTAPTSNNGVSRWTILWRPLNTNKLTTGQ